jgi:uncharacterized protein YyaL (SSP411 family)
MQPGKNKLLILIVAVSLASGILGCTASRIASAPGAAATPAATAPASSPSCIAWQSWSDDLFARAKREHKFVLLDLEAVWCHWCHVEDEITYRDPKVIELMNAKYIAVKVDQDSRPDISNRYEDYGWPATVVFNADGGEIVKRRGYLPPKEMSSMLQAIIDDPTPGPSVEPTTQITYGDATALPAGLQKQLEDGFLAGYDAQLGGWGHIHKYVDWDKMEFEMARFRAGDAEAGKRAKTTLTSGLKLIDPVWGGAYQYSIEGDWDHPHFEKLMQFQGEQMRIYSLAYLTFHDPAYLKAASDIHRYINAFLRGSDGAYEVSQDADLVDGVYAEDYFKLDDANRRKQGTPRVDAHQYARENGWAISGLAALYAAEINDSADSEATLKDAIVAAKWVLANRALAGGGFRHGEHDSAGPYLGDTLYMGRAFLDLYAVTADRAWLAHARDVAAFIGAHFTAGVPAGFATIAAKPDGAFPPQAEVAENVIAARFFNLLSHYSGKVEHHQLAERAMKFLATPAIATAPDAPGAGILLASREFDSEPLHVAIVGAKGSPDARTLFNTAVDAPTWYKRVEWFDAAEGPLPNPDVDYPQFKFAAAFFCTGSACSSPVKTAEALRAKFKAAIQ